MITADLSGQRALVTGGSSGIGLGCVMLLARMGAKVALNHLPDDPRGPGQAAALVAEGMDVVAVAGDVSRAGAAEDMVARAIEKLGGLNYLVNNAGTSGTSEPIPPQEMDRMTEEFWGVILSTNLLGPFRCSRAAAPILRAAKGAIVNVASVAGLGKQGSSTAYSASKTALVSLTRSLARALGPDVRVNAVAPGLTETGWTATWPEEYKQAIREAVTLKRSCRPEDIAEVVLFLCAGAAMITGQTIAIDGGMMLV